MRTVGRAVLVSVALTSASLAFACPIDLAGADVTLSVDPVRPNEAVLWTLSADVDAVASSAIALLDDNDAPITAADDHDAVPIIQDDARAEMIDVLPGPSPEAATTPV